MKRKVLSLLLTLALCLSLVPLTAVPVSAATVSNVIKSFDFETDPTVEGWTFVDADGDARSWVWSENNSQYSGNGYDGSKCIVSRYNQYGDVDNWAISPAVDLSMYTAGDQLELSLYAKKNSDTYVEHFQIWAGTSADKDQMTCISGNEDIVPTSSYARYKADLSAFTGKEMVYVAIRHCNSFDQFNLLVDRVEICKLEEVIPVTTYDLYVGSVQVNENNASNVLGDGTVSYDPNSNTLTLNNANITGGSENTNYYGWGICYRGSDDFNIVANGDNTVKDDSYRTYASYGIMIGEPSPLVQSTAAVDVTITVADGASLTVSGGNINESGFSGSLGIYNKGSGSLTINGAGNLIASAKNNYEDSIGILAQDVTIDGSCSVTATGGDSGSNMSAGIYCGNLIIPQSFTGSVTAQSGSAPATAGYGTNGTFGILARGNDSSSGNVSISGGTVTTQTGARTGGTNSSNEYATGIYGDYTISITNGATVKASGDGHGMFCYQGTASIDASSVIIIGGSKAANGLDLTNVTALASTEISGSNAVEYNSSAYSTYKWVKTEPTIYYTVTINPNNGIDSSSAYGTVPAGGDFTLPKCDCTAPEGQQFKAWNVEGTEYDPGDNIKVNANVTVKAIWEDIPTEPTFTLTYDANGGSGTMDSETYTSGAAIKLKSCGFTAPSGQKFKAWDIDGTEYAVGGGPVATADFTAKAIWEDAPPASGGGGGGATTYPVTPAEAENGKITVSPKNAAEGDKVTITVTPDEGYELDKLTVKDKDGNEIKAKDNGDGTFTIEMPASEIEVEATFKEAEETPGSDDGFPFVDVPEDAYYRKPVEWAVENGITSGVSEDKYGPELSCTRAQVVTFLWITCGSEDAGTETGFDDVDVDAYYDKAVAWAVEKGITAGTSENEFSPEMTVTRAQFVTMLWVANGMPEVDGEMPFKDVPQDSYYAKAVAWAYANDITAGKSTESFAPDDPCTRGQIMTFLYNAYVE